MNIELSRDAVLLKIKSRWDAPLISALEYSYAAGLGLRKMGTDDTVFRELRLMEDFVEFRDKVKELAEEYRNDFPQHGQNVCKDFQPLYLIQRCRKQPLYERYLL